MSKTQYLTDHLQYHLHATTDNILVTALPEAGHGQRKAAAGARGSGNPPAPRASERGSRAPTATPGPGQHRRAPEPFSPRSPEPRRPSLRYLSLFGPQLGVVDEETEQGRSELLLLGGSPRRRRRHTELEASAPGAGRRRHTPSGSSPGPSAGTGTSPTPLPPSPPPRNGTARPGKCSCARRDTALRSATAGGEREVGGAGQPCLGHGPVL